jgi:replicative DNA helicase
VARAADEVVRLQGGGDHRLPPQNLDAEQSVLGAMMLSGEAVADVVELLDADDFYRSAHGRIYAALRSLFARGEPVDVISVADALKREGRLDDVGGPLYLRDLVDQTPTPAGAAHYARIVADAALRRRLIGAAADIMDLAFVAGDDADVIADHAEQRIYDVARREDADEVAVLRDLVDQAMADLESIQTRESAYTGLPTGYRDIDDLTSGLQPGNLVIVAARPGVGKSSLAMNVARNVAVSGAPVAVFSLEMSRTEIGMRLLCAEAHVPWDRIRNKRVGPDDWTRVVSAAEVLHDAPLHIVDAGNVNIVDIRAKARRMRSSRQGLSLIIVDYLQLMTSPMARRPDNRQQEVAEISRSLKLLAKELHIPVMALSQLNRNPEARADKRPQLSDLRESGAIEQDSDVVMFIHRDDADPEKKRDAELIVAKHRNGPTGSIRLNFEPSLTQFRNAARTMEG